MSLDRIEVFRGDITSLEGPICIVNAATNSLLGGRGVDGAIHKAAGRGLLEECRQIGGCDTGDAKITGGHNMNCKYIIHTVGPVYSDGNNGEPAMLASSYRKCLELATDYRINTIAFPNISTGIYGYPKEAAAFIAVQETLKYIQNHEIPEKVIFCVFNQENEELYNSILLKGGE